MNISKLINYSTDMCRIGQSITIFLNGVRLRNVFWGRAEELGSWVCVLVWRWWPFIGSTCLEKGFRMSQSKWVLIKKIGFLWTNWCLRTWCEEQMKVGLLKRRKKIKMASCNYWTSTSLCTQITETCTRWS